MITLYKWWTLQQGLYRVAVQKNDISSSFMDCILIMGLPESDKIFHFHPSNGPIILRQCLTFLSFLIDLAESDKVFHFPPSKFQYILILRKGLLVSFPSFQWTYHAQAMSYISLLSNRPCRVRQGLSFPSFQIPMGLSYSGKVLQFHFPPSNASITFSEGLSFPSFQYTFQSQARSCISLLLMDLPYKLRKGLLSLSC